MATTGQEIQMQLSSDVCQLGITKILKMILHHCASTADTCIQKRRVTATPATDRASERVVWFPGSSSPSKTHDTLLTLNMYALFIRSTHIPLLERLSKNKGRRLRIP